MTSVSQNAQAPTHFSDSKMGSNIKNEVCSDIWCVKVLQRCTMLLAAWTKKHDKSQNTDTTPCGSGDEFFLPRSQTEDNPKVYHASYFKLSATCITTLLSWFMLFAYLHTDWPAYLFYREDHFGFQDGVLDRQAAGGGRRVRVCLLAPHDFGDLQTRIVRKNNISEQNRVINEEYRYFVYIYI